MHHHSGSSLRRKGAACGPLASRHPAYAAYARVEQVPIKSPNKPVDNGDCRTRHRWSAECAYADEQEKTKPLVAGGGPVVKFRPPGYEHNVPAGVPLPYSRPHRALALTGL